jgi:hypothetical protein
MKRPQIAVCFELVRRLPLKSHGARMRTVLRVILVVALVCASGCTAHPDWIERTLVTVDVTGVWSGAISQGGSYVEVSMVLKQEGPKVTGSLRWRGFSEPRVFGDLPGPVQGTVSGDRFEFSRTGLLSADLIVSGDEMTGPGHVNSGPASIVLRRVNSSALPSSSKP